MTWSLRGNLQGPTTISNDAANASRLGSDGKIYTPAGSTYVLPVAQASVLGGIKANIGTAGQFVNGIATDGSLVFATPAGGVTNPVNGSVVGMTLWIGTQAAYDAIATKDAKTVYNITA
jgi:hypothetical protein